MDRLANLIDYENIQDIFQNNLLKYPFYEYKIHYFYLSHHFFMRNFLCFDINKFFSSFCLVTIIMTVSPYYPPPPPPHVIVSFSCVDIHIPVILVILTVFFSSL